MYWQRVTWPSCLMNLLEYSLPCWGAWESGRLQQTCASFLLRDLLHPPPPPPHPSHWSCCLAGRWPCGHQRLLMLLGRKGLPAYPPASAFFSWILLNFSSCAACIRNTIVLCFSVAGRRPQKNKCPVRCRSGFPQPRLSLSLRMAQHTAKRYAHD